MVGIWMAWIAPSLVKDFSCYDPRRRIIAQVITSIQYQNIYIFFAQVNKIISTQDYSARLILIVSLAKAKFLTLTV